MMLLSDPGEANDPIAPQTRRVAGLLAREKTGEILAHLHRRPYRSASEIARLEEIHVATAQRYLKELAEAGLLGSRLRQAGARPTEEYWLINPKITLTVDLAGQGAPRPEELVALAEGLTIRGAIPDDVVFETDARTQAITSLLVLSGHHPREVSQRIRIPETLGRFLAHLPPAGKPDAVLAVFERAGLDPARLAELLAGLVQLAHLDTNGAQARARDPAVALAPSVRKALDSLAQDAQARISPLPESPIIVIAPRKEVAA